MAKEKTIVQADVAASMSCQVVDLSGTEKGSVELNRDIFGVEIKKHIVAEVVRWQLAKRRAGTHSTLTRSDVRGTTKKCKPQKEQGTRHGDKRAPIFRKGGIVFGPKPRSHEFSLNKKVKTLGLKVVLSDKFNNQYLKVVDSLALESMKTANLKQMLDKMGVEKALFVSDVIDTNFSKALNNIPHLDAIPVAGLNVYDMLKHRNIVITKAGLKALDVRLA